MAGTAKSIFHYRSGIGAGPRSGALFRQCRLVCGLGRSQRSGHGRTALLLPSDMYSIHKLDVTDRAQWKQAVADFGQHTGGRMTVLFNNAGIGSGGPIQDMTDEEIDKMIAVNLTGVISGTRACFDLLKDTPDACVLYTSSAAGIYGSANLSVYSATKFAVRGLAEAHDIEWRALGIKSRSLMPGFIDTNIISAVDPGSNMTGKERLQSAGLEVSPVSIIGPAAWDAIHGNKVHTTVNKTARDLAFAARWFPNRLRKKLGLMGNLAGAVQTKPE